MKKILIVGGGVNQVSLIKASHREGYFATVVDYAGENCPAYALADRFYNVSSQDEAAIFEVAKKEKVDGIVSNSEASMLIVNSIAEKLKLNGNPPVGIEKLISKSEFRDLQKSVGLYAPNHFEVSTTDEAVEVAEKLRFPIIIKPCVSSGSRGCKKIGQFDGKEISTTFQECSHYSRNNKVEIEEFVSMPSLRTIEGDVFVYDNLIIWDGLFYTTRASWAPMVPMTYTAPLLIEDSKLNSIKAAVSQVIDSCGIRFGEFNIEGYFTESGEFFLIEINARQGGNFLPRFLQRFTGIDYDRLLVTTCVNDRAYYDSIITSERNVRYAIMNSVYSQEEGEYKGLSFDSTIKDNVTNVSELLSVGDKVEKCIDGSGIVASVDFEFDSMKELYYYTPRIIDSIRVKLSTAS